MPASKMKVEFKGGTELARALKEFPNKYQNQVVGAGLRAAGKPVLDEAKTDAPVDTGRLQMTLVQEMRRNRSTKAPYVAIGAAQSGTRRFARKFGDKSKNKLTSDAYYIKFVHDGTRYQAPQPFLKVALFSRATEAIDAFGDVSRQKLEKLK